ncbi:hypothetical protein WG899_05475 [Paucibacter sp. AS339]|uniref:hypothetical protein n=1 Tax=Paucibacter hankyongi TaxID=3133434 RepID=UPI0030A71F3E
MHWRLRSILRRWQVAMQPMRERGWSVLSVVLWHVPVAACFRAWRAWAQRFDGGKVQQAFNRQRFSDFQDGLPASSLPRFYVIVMPCTLHFLLPCLALLEGQAQVVLLANGARRWELDLLQRRWPTLPVFKLRTLPLTSIAHGHVINLLLENHRGNFGIVDHDCYVFDRSIFEQLQPAIDDCCLLSLFAEESQSAGHTFPLTFFLYFNAEILKALMHEYGVDARLYRWVPERAQTAMASIGLGPNTFWKHYHNFRDTLHVLLGVALAEGQRIQFLNAEQPNAASHVGGTSIGTHHTKNLPALYAHLCFLELANDPLLSRRYAFLTAPLRTSGEVLLQAELSDASRRGIDAIDALIQQLRERLSPGEH